MDDWKPIETAPHDRTWFLARTAWGAMRFVHFADDCDRYPISHDGECWPTPPIEWCAVNIPDLVAALRRVTAERDALKAAQNHLTYAAGEDALEVQDLRAEVATLRAELDAARGRVKRPRFIETRYGDAASWGHKSDYGHYIYGIDFAGKAYSQTPNAKETDHADIEAAEAFVVAEYRATVSARILAALEPDPAVVRMREALELAANRLHRCSVDYDTGTHEFIETGEWAAEARAAITAWENRNGS